MRKLDPIRQLVVDTATARGVTLAALSCVVGRNPAYMQQYVERGSPRVLPEYERRLLAMFFEIDERRLGARDPWTPARIAA